MEAIGTVICLGLAFMAGIWLMERPYRLAILGSLVGALYLWLHYHA